MLLPGYIKLHTPLQRSCFGNEFNVIMNNVRVFTNYVYEIHSMNDIQNWIDAFNSLASKFGQECFLWKYFTEFFSLPVVVSDHCMIGAVPVLVPHVCPF